MQTEIKNLEKSEVEITSAISWEEFVKHEDKAIQKLASKLELDGFRTGKVPLDLARTHIPDMMILEEMAQDAIYKAYPLILKDQKIDAIGHPSISITKIARGESLEFKIVTAVLPTIELSDYKTLAKKQKENNPIKEIVADENDVEKAIMDLRKMRAEQKMPPHEHVEGEEHIHEEIKEEDLPVFNDEFVKSFGDFADTEAFKNKIRENLKKEKETVEKDKLRFAIVEELIKESKADIPEILVQSEIEKILFRLKSDITNMGYKYEDYLLQIKKTEEELRNEWRSDAEKRAKLEMIIHTISEKENLKPNTEEVDKEVANIMNMYKDADEARARAYVENMLTNEKVFVFLENQ